MYNIYKINYGESLDDIARKFNTTTDMLIQINDMNINDYLRTGDEIIVPDTSKQYFEYYTIQKGDSLYQIARKYNINPKLLASLNGLNDDDYIYPNQVILIPKANYSYYITKDGDTLEEVAKTFNISLNDLIINNPTIYLLEGQLLVKNNR